MIAAVGGGGGGAERHPALSDHRSGGVRPVWCSGAEREAVAGAYRVQWWRGAVITMEMVLRFSDHNGGEVQ